MSKPLIEPGILAALWTKLVGGTPATGKVPTRQADGTVQWQTPSGGGGAIAQSYWDLGLSAGADSMTISNSAKTAENSGATASLQLISYPFFGGDGGNYYFEVLIDSAAGNIGVGVVTRELVIRNNLSGAYVGQGNQSYGYWLNGQKYNNGLGTSGYPTFTSGDVIGVAAKTSLGDIWFRKNGTWIEGDPSTGAVPSYTHNRLRSHLHVYVTPYATGSKATLRGLSSEFSYPPPAGFVGAFDV